MGLIFTDAFERSIDDKNRLQIPAPYRNALDPDRTGAALYLVPGERDNTLSLYPAEFFQSKVAALPTDRMADALDFEQLFFSQASRIEMDKQGRILLPERLLSSVDLGRDIYITGANYRLDLWSKRDYEGFLRNKGDQRAMMQRYLRGGVKPAGEVKEEN